MPMKSWIAAALWLACCHSAWAADIRFSTHGSEVETTVDEMGEIRGKPQGGKRAFYVELVREMMLAMKVRPAMEHVPLARGLNRVQKEENQAFFNVVRTGEREHTVKWVGPLTDANASYFYALKSAGGAVRSLDDAKKVKSIAVLRAGVHETTLRALGFTNLYPVNSYHAALLMLKKNRVTLTPAVPEGLLQRLREAGMLEHDVVQTPVVVSDGAGYLCFSKDVPDEVVAQWQAALTQIRKSGRYDQIYKAYYAVKTTP